MYTLPQSEVITDASINANIRSGQLGVIVNDHMKYEVVYFTHCHYYGSGGRVSNTFTYRSFSKNGTLRSKEKSYMYKPIYGLKDKTKFKTKIVLITGEDNAD